MRAHQRLARLWLVEDNELDIALIQRVFQQMNLEFELEIFRSGGDVATHLKEHAHATPDRLPDLIFLDLTLPIISGMDLLGRLKGNQHYASIPVVVLSASNYVMDRENTTRKGALLHIGKPLQPPHLDKIIDTIAELSLQKEGQRLMLMKQLAEEDGY